MKDLEQIVAKDWGDYANFIINLINHSEKFKRDDENQSFVMSIDSKWGTGKTTFIKFLESNTNENIVFIHYDSWKSDFWENAFDPLINTMIRDKNFQSFADKMKTKEVWKNLLKSAFFIGTGLVEKFANKYIGEERLKEAKTYIDRAFKSIKENGNGTFSTLLKKDVPLFKEYEEFQKNLDEFKCSLSTIIEKSAKKFVVVIDELDRCRPDFAIKTLEIVKHIFDVKDLVFILSLDMSQLSFSLKTIYGNDMDTLNYLHRFFDYNSKLPPHDKRGYIERELNKYNCLQKEDDEPIREKIIDFLCNENKQIREIQVFIKAAILIEQKIKNFDNVYRSFYYDLLVFKMFFWDFIETFNKNKTNFWNECEKEIGKINEYYKNLNIFKLLISQKSVKETLKIDVYNGSLIAGYCYYDMYAYRFKEREGALIITKSYSDCYTKFPAIDKNDWDNLKNILEMPMHTFLCKKIEIIDILLNDLEEQTNEYNS